MTVLINPYRFGTSGGGPAPGFSPDDIASLEVWYDARLQTGYSDGNTLTAVDDQTTNGNDVSAVEGNPTYQTGETPGGAAVFRFDGVGDALVVPYNVDIAAATTFVYVKWAGSGVQWAFSARASGERWYVGRADGSNDIDCYVGGSGAQRAITGFSTTTYYALALRADGNDKSIWVDGSSVNTFVNTTTGTTSSQRIGSVYNDNTNEPLDGDVALFLHYSAALSDSEMGDVFDWIDANF